MDLKLGMPGYELGYQRAVKDGFFSPQHEVARKHNATPNLNSISRNNH